MGEIDTILAHCSRWELDALRAMGMSVPRGVKPTSIENVYVPKKLSILWTAQDAEQQIKAQGKWNHGRPEGSGGRQVWTNKGEHWTAIALAARKLGVPYQQITRALIYNIPCRGRYMSDKSKADAIRRSKDSAKTAA